MRRGKSFWCRSNTSTCAQLDVTIEKSTTITQGVLREAIRYKTYFCFDSNTIGRVQYVYIIVGIRKENTKTQNGML
jgi:hypothetical protein